MKRIALVAALTACSRSSRNLDLDWISVAGGETKLGCDRWPAAYDYSRLDACVGYEYPRFAQVAQFDVLRDLVVHSAYAACIDDGACTKPVREWAPAPSLPDEKTLATLPIAVSLDQAKAFCAWQHATLPTLEQWERLVRGNGDALYPRGDDEPDCDQVPAHVVERYGPMIPCKLESQDHYRSASPVGARSLVGWRGEWVEGPRPPARGFDPKELRASLRTDGKASTFDPSKIETFPDTAQAPIGDQGIIKGMYEQTVGEHMLVARNSTHVFRCVRPPQPAR